ncbi:hypothetical protein D3C85_774530 [compost metagenome]
MERVSNRSSAGTFSYCAWCRSWQVYCVSGWLALCHSTATGQWLAAQRTSIPALRAPVDHPPRPASKSIAVGIVDPRRLAYFVEVVWATLITSHFFGAVMSDSEKKEQGMSDCAYCGLTMDFVPDNLRHRFEIQCEHCQKINVVTWEIWAHGRWYTAIKPD